MCTAKECKVPDRIYESRHEWFTHEMQEHRNCWECIEGCNTTFHSQDVFRRHLGEAHDVKADNNRMHDVMQSCERRISMDTMAKCPLCRIEQYSLTQLRRHLGKHHTELALFAIPSHVEAEDDEQEEFASESRSELSATSSARSVVPALETCSKCFGKYHSDNGDRQDAGIRHELYCPDYLPSTSTKDLGPHDTSIEDNAHICTDEQIMADKQIRDEDTTEIEREDKMKSIEEERQTIVDEIQDEMREQPEEAMIRQQRAVDDYNEKKFREEQEAKEQRERVIYEFERDEALYASQGQRDLFTTQLEAKEAEMRKQDELEYEAFLERQRAKEADEQSMKKRQEEDFKSAMRDRLSQSGFRDEQIETLLLPKEQPDSQSIKPQPTYAKISRTHLDVETLHFYEVPYEYDTVRSQAFTLLTTIR
jgi:hypothetical protein